MGARRNSEAWLMAALIRAKKLPKLAEMTGERRAETREEMVNRMRSYFSMHNARVAAQGKKHG